MSIHENVTKLLASGVASANRYEVIYSGRALGATLTRELNEHSKYLVSSATLPGRSFTSGQIRGDQGLGVERKYVTGVMFNEFTLTYTLTGDMATHQIMNEWFETCAPRLGGPHSARKDIRIGYYNDYVDPKIIIKKMERDGKVSMTTEVYNAYPIMVADLSLSSGANNSALEFSVQFAYETFNNIYGGLSSEQVSGGNSGFGPAVTDAGYEKGKAALTISSFKEKQNADNIETGYEEAVGPVQAVIQRSLIGNPDDGGSGSGSGNAYSSGTGAGGGSEEIVDQTAS